MITAKNHSKLFKKKNKCPICKRENFKEKQHIPFCSKHCSDIDLSKWFEGKYYFSDDNKITND